MPPSRSRRSAPPRRAPLGLLGPLAPRIVAIVVAAAVIGAGVTFLGSMTDGPLDTVGEVAGAAGTPGPRGTPVTALASQGPSPRPVGQRSPDPTPTPAATPTPPEMLTGYQWPLPKGRLTLPFGPSPWGSRIVDGQKFHDGLDLATFCGDRIVAAHPGTVLAAGRRYDKVMGWVGDLQPYLDRLDKKKLYPTLPVVVVIDDGNGYRSVYAHFSKATVKKGDEVEAGQLIGYEGRTGRASGCHLHYGLFSPLETATFGIDPAVVKRMKLPDRHIARIDPMLVLPERPKPTKRPSPEPTGTPAG
ncbi:MAG: M23 family metallopeptidase [Chloroflexota bacterium]